MVDRRRFITAAAGSALALVHPLSSWPGDTSPYAHPIPPGWLPTPELIRQLPKMLELAAVPGVSAAVVDASRVWEQGFGSASVDPIRRVGDGTVSTTIS